MNQGEEVVLDLKPHWWFFAKHIAVGTVLFVLLIFLWVELHGDIETVSLWAWALAALVWAVWLGVKYLDWQFTHFVVTSNRVIYRTGVLAKHGVEIPMERISNINFHQGIVDRLVGAGSLEIESAGHDGESRFSHVRHPDGVQQEIYRQIEANGRRRAAWSRDANEQTFAPAPAQAAPSAASIPDQLKQLAELRDSGVITAAEFETKKAQLLERM
jgi:uncharacterized membrane protein YdbT with pleckstrin-like domain